MSTTSSIVERLDQDIWSIIASRLSPDERIRLSATCRLLGPLDVFGRGDIRVLYPRARVLDELHRHRQVWRRRCNLYPANRLTFVKSTLEPGGLGACNSMALVMRWRRTAVFLREVCPGPSDLHAAHGRVAWPTRHGWRRMSSSFLREVKALQCCHCGSKVRLDLIMTMAQRVVGDD